nr:MAG: terminase large subunit [Caudoviricetes sp.]
MNRYGKWRNTLNSRKKQTLDLLWKEPYKIGHWVGFKDLTALHNEWLRSFLYADADQTLLAHRGSYKTTDLSLFLAIHTVLRPNENVMFFRKTDTDVTEVMTQAQNILLSPVMVEVVRHLYGTELVLLKSNASEIHTNLCTSTRGVSQIVGLGINTSITGKHADIVVTDDVVNLKDRVSKAERERTKVQYMELQNVRNRGGRFINTGTPWHKEDAISIMPNVRRFDCYSTGLISREKLEQLRQAMSDSLFSANYELKHIADKDAMFQNPRFTGDESLLYDGMAHIDAAYDGEDGTAFTIFKKQSDGAIVGFGKRWNRHVDDCLGQIAVYHKRFRAGMIHCEDNADKGYLRKEIGRMGLPVSGYHESMNKFVKISTYLRKNWNRIVWLEETDPEYINEILDYNEFAEHDDSPDSAASLLRKMENKTAYNPIEGGI